MPVAVVPVLKILRIRIECCVCAVSDPAGITTVSPPTVNTLTAPSTAQEIAREQAASSSVSEGVIRAIWRGQPLRESELVAYASTATTAIYHLSKSTVV